MKQTFEILNVKCGGCANTLKKSLAEDFGEVEVDLESDPRKITLEIGESEIPKLSLKLRAIGYPLTTDELSKIEKFTMGAKSFVSCAIGKMDS